MYPSAVDVVRWGSINIRNNNNNSTHHWLNSRNSRDNPEISPLHSSSNIASNNNNNIKRVAAQTIAIDVSQILMSVRWVEVEAGASPWGRAPAVVRLGELVKMTLSRGPGAALSSCMPHQFPTLLASSPLSPTPSEYEQQTRRVITEDTGTETTRIGLIRTNSIKTSRSDKMFHTKIASNKLSKSKISEIKDKNKINNKIKYGGTPGVGDGKNKVRIENKNKNKHKIKNTNKITYNKPPLNRRWTFVRYVPLNVSGKVTVNNLVKHKYKISEIKDKNKISNKLSNKIKYAIKLGLVTDECEHNNKNKNTNKTRHITMNKIMFDKTRKSVQKIENSAGFLTRQTCPVIVCVYMKLCRSICNDDRLQMQRSLSDLHINRNDENKQTIKNRHVSGFHYITDSKGSTELRSCFYLYGTSECGAPGVKESMIRRQCKPNNSETRGIDEETGIITCVGTSPCHLGPVPTVVLVVLLISVIPRSAFGVWDDVAACHDNILTDQPP